ncbi:hypothetical protein N7488_002761 [Penicillium malachiteum]|nr:hypothetical protein N7488_002761 [Penicillium malachiteum]
MACYYAHKDLTLWLVHPDRSLATLHGPTVAGNTPLLSAAYGLGNNDCIPNDPNGDIFAKDHGKHEEFLCFLLDQGCLIHHSDIRATIDGEEKFQSTVLGAAIPHASYEMVSRLIAEGAQVHARQKWRVDYSPIHLHFIVDDDNATALHIASYFWNVEAIRALFNNKGDLSIVDMTTAADDHGQIPLHLALRGVLNEFGQKPIAPEKISQRVKTVKLLLEANPGSINGGDTYGATVFNYALRSDTPLESTLHIVHLLLNAAPLTSTLKTPGVVE